MSVIFVLKIMQCMAVQNQVSVTAAWPRIKIDDCSTGTTLEREYG